jgi:hypothetical protein
MLVFSAKMSGVSFENIFPGRARHCAYLILICLLGGDIKAQSFWGSQVAHHLIGQSASIRRETIARSGRFLGWKFATRSHQNIEKWQRSKLQNKHLPVSPMPRSSAHSGAGAIAAIASSNAGFDWRSSLPAGYIPTAVTSGDFNGDGKMDFAISNGGDNTIYVFLGNGAGTFEVPEILFTAGQSPDWITAVQLRPNGPLDLAVTDGDSNDVEVFLGNGDGTFQPSTLTSLPQIPTFILAADVNKDGNQDLVVGLTIDTDATEPQLQVLFGNGSGGFSGSLFSPAIYGNPDGPVPTNWVAVGDVNNDGYVDFVTTDALGSAIPYLNHLGSGLLMGNPFAPNNGADDGALVVELGDMNEDGCLDAIETDFYAQVNIATGTCDGNFPTSSPATPLGDFDPAVKVIDVNGDGHLDVVGSAVWYPNNGGAGFGVSGGYLVSVLMGDGKGNLGSASVYRGGTSAYSLIVDDFDGDGRPEILTADSVENQVSLFINDGSGKYGNPQGESIGYTGGGPINAPNTQAPMEVADLNGDGKPDLFLVEDGLDCCLPSQLTVMLNDGTGKFLPAVRTPITVGDDTPVPRFIAGAFRSPAALDVIYINTYNGTNSIFNVAFFRGNGDGAFAPPVTLTTLPFPEQVVAADFNNDGKLDFAVMGTDSTGEIWEFDVFLGHGDGTFNHLPPQSFPMLGTDGAQQLFAVDLNHDGKLDLLIGLNANGGWVPSGDNLIEVLGNGDGTFQTPTTLISHFGAVAVADVNGDGYPDLIQKRDPKTDISVKLLTEPGITVYLGSANGTFQKQPSYDLPGVALPSLNPAIVRDFNGDGIPDIALPYWPAPPPVYLIEPLLLVAQGVGDGTFIVTGHNYQLPALSDPFAGADFNDDGTTDLVDLVGLTSSFTTIPAAPGPALDISLDSNPITGNSGTATITLNLPATSTETVNLSASDPAIELPATVTFTAGQQAQDISFTLGSGFDATHVFALYATLGSQTAVAYGTKPNPNLNAGGVIPSLSSAQYPVLMSLGLEPGEGYEFAFTITSNGGYAGTFSSLQCAGLPAGASCAFSANSIVVAAGKSGQVEVSLSTSSSIPLSLQTVTISATDGVLPTEAGFQFGIGDFSFSVLPTTIVVGPTGNAVATLTSKPINGLNDPMSFVCTGLPTGTQCAPDGTLYTVGGAVALGLSYQGLAAQDYPFQITGTADIVSHTISAVLRVGDFTASLDKTTATLSAGQSATFNVTLNSVNHYTGNITVLCQPPVNSVTCAVFPSPAALTDDGTATVQLTVTNTAAATSGIRHTASRSPGRIFWLALVMPLPLLLVRRRGHALLRLIVVVGLASLISCGGGGSPSGIGAGGNGGGGGSPQTISISIVAQAATTQSDSNNQKALGPIVVTLD